MLQMQSVFYFPKSSHSEDLTLGTLVDDISRAPIPKARECKIIVLQLTHLQHP